MLKESLQAESETHKDYGPPDTKPIQQLRWRRLDCIDRARTIVDFVDGSWLSGRMKLRALLHITLPNRGGFLKSNECILQQRLLVAV